MSIVRVGTNKKYADNWGNIFSGKKSAASAEAKGKKTAAKAAVKSTAKKSAKKKSAKR